MTRTALVLLAAVLLVAAFFLHGCGQDAGEPGGIDAAAADDAAPDAAPPNTTVKTFEADNLPLIVPSAGTVDATIPVAGSGTLRNVEATFRFDPKLQPTRELNIILVAPNGDTLELFPHDQCGTLAVFGPYTFKDGSGRAWMGQDCIGNPGAPMLPGDYSPSSAAASFSNAFNGDSGNGQWRLRLVTRNAVADTPLVQAELRLTYDAP